MSENKEEEPVKQEAEENPVEIPEVKVDTGTGKEEEPEVPKNEEAGGKYRLNWIAYCCFFRV
jgi:hypothetical protein